MEEKKRSAWRIWLYLAPLYLLIAYPLTRKMAKLNSPDLPLTSEQYSAFASTQEYVNAEPPGTDSGGQKPYSIYQAPPEKPLAPAGKKPALRSKPAKNAHSPQNNAKPQPAKSTAGRGNINLSVIKQLEMKTLGYAKGYLLDALDKVMGNPALVKRFLDNPLIINGFMERPTVKTMLNNPQALQRFLTDTPAINNFLGNSVIQKALGNQQVMQAVASSKMADTVLSAPATQALIKNSDIIAAIVKVNPQAAAFLENPAVLNAFSANPIAQQAYQDYMTNESMK